MNQKLPGKLIRQNPFFIIGCVRSGTTMLRDVLRRHPNLACPEETHFYRWAEPFGTDGLTKILTGNSVLKRHRQIDGISEAEFERILADSESRGDVYSRYMAAYIKKNKPSAKRWFDKTPQNVYGAFMAAAQFPHAKFIHIVRNPLNVAASLRIGKVMNIQKLVGAANYWNESIGIIRGLKRAYPNLVHELKYEDFSEKPLLEIECILDFLNEDYSADYFADIKISESSHMESNVLSAEEISRVSALCETGMRRYGYL